MSNNYCILNSLREYSDLMLGNTDTLNFQNLFNRLMSEIDPEFYPIRQKNDHGNDGYSKTLKTQFACYAPEQKTMEKDSFNKSVVSKATHDLDSFIKYGLDNPDRLNNVKQWVFVLNHSEVPDDLKTFIETTAPKLITEKLQGYTIDVTLWFRKHILEKCESLSKDQYQRVFKLPDSSIQNQYDNRPEDINNELELLECQENIKYYRNKGNENLIDIINAKLQERSLSLTVKIFYQRQKAICLSTLKKFDEAYCEIEALKKSYDQQNYPLDKYYQDYCSILYNQSKGDELQQKLSEILPKLSPISIKNWAFLVGCCFDKSEFRFQVEHDFTESLDFKKGQAIKLAMVEKYDDALQLIVDLKLKLSEENDDVFNIYANILYKKYANSFLDFSLTSNEQKYITSIYEFAIENKNELLKNQCLYLLKRFQEIDLTYIPCGETITNCYVLMLGAIHQKEYDFILSAIESYVKARKWNELMAVLPAVFIYFHEYPQYIKNRFSSISKNILEHIDYTLPIIDDQPIIISQLYKFTNEHQKHYDFLQKYKDIQSPIVLYINIDLLKVSMTLNKHLEERQKICEKILKSIEGQESNSQEIKDMIHLFFENQRIDLIKALYRMKIQDNLSDYEKDLDYIFLYLLNTYDQSLVDEFIEDYFESEIQSTNSAFLYWISIYAVCFSYTSISKFRQHLDILKDNDPFVRDNIYGFLCLYEYTEESLKINQSFYETIASNPYPVSVEQLQVYCGYFHFYGFIEEMYQWLYFHWRRNPTWDIWNAGISYWIFPSNISKILNTNKQIYILKNKYLPTLMYISIEDHNEDFPTINNFYDISSESSNAKSIKKSNIEDELILDGEIKGTWILEAIVPNIHFFINNILKKSPYLIQGSIEDLDLSEKGVLLEWTEAMMQQLNLQVIQEQKKQTSEVKNPPTIDKASFILDTLEYIFRISFFINIKKNTNKEFLKLPILDTIKYRSFCQFMESKPKVVCDSLNLWWLFSMHQVGINLAILFETIIISSLTWKDIIFDMITPDYTYPLVQKQAFIKWIKQNVEIQNAVIKEEIFDLFKEAKKQKVLMPVDIGSLSLLLNEPTALLLSCPSQQAKVSILYFLEFCISENIININQLLTCINSVRENFFNEFEQELYKIPLRYIYNEYTETPEILEQIDWGKFYSNKMSEILDEIEDEIRAPELKYLILEKIDNQKPLT